MIPIYLATPSRAAMHNLTAEHVKPLKNECENTRGLVVCHGSYEVFSQRTELAGPVFVTGHFVLIEPEWAVDVAVLHQFCDRTTEFQPQCIM